MKTPKPVTIPNYIKEILSRSNYVFDYYTTDPNYAAGYTIRIDKATPYTWLKTFKSEITALEYWVQSTYKRIYNDDSIIFHLIYIPTRTHHNSQFAIVTIFDPIMKHLEPYIPKKGK